MRRLLPLRAFLFLSFFGIQAFAAIDVQILAINDLHGHLDADKASGNSASTVATGGIEYLATHINQLRAQNNNTLLVAAGDLIGASPLLSALFHDEPTINAMNALGLDFSSVGNHEFDEGTSELLRMQHGGCHPKDGCLLGTFSGAQFEYLAANVIENDTQQTLFPSYGIREVQGVKIAFIGLVLNGAADIIRADGIKGVSFVDEADRVNALVPELLAQGVNSIVLLIHEGLDNKGAYNDCKNISGGLIDIVNRLDDAVDVVVSGHTHEAYNCQIKGKLVTSAASYGRVITDIDLTFDSATKRLTKKAAVNRLVTQDVPKNPVMVQLLDGLREQVAPIAGRKVGTITDSFSRSPTRQGESQLGRLLADAQLEGASAEGAQIALMNPGGIRASLLYLNDGSNGTITYGDIYTVQPFANPLLTVSLTGQQLKNLLEQQFDGCNSYHSMLLSVSAGFEYAYDPQGPVCNKIDPNSLRLNRAAIVPEQTYRVAANAFLADGGDGFDVFKLGLNRTYGMLDIEALEQFFIKHSPLSPGGQARITRRHR